MTETLEKEDKDKVTEKIRRFNKMLNRSREKSGDFGGKEQERENIITMTRNRSALPGLELLPPVVHLCNGVLDLACVVAVVLGNEFLGHLI